MHHKIKFYLVFILTIVFGSSFCVLKAEGKAAEIDPSIDQLFEEFASLPLIDKMQQLCNFYCYYAWTDKRHEKEIDDLLKEATSKYPILEENRTINLDMSGINSTKYQPNMPVEILERCKNIYPEHQYKKLLLLKIFAHMLKITVAAYEETLEDYQVTFFFSSLLSSDAKSKFRFLDIFDQVKRIIQQKTKLHWQKR